MKEKRQVIKYLIFDFFTAGAAWTLFFLFRKIYIEPLKFGYKIPIEFSLKYFLGLIILPLFWITLYSLTGYYKDIYHKSRLKELGQTLFISLIGTVIIFFILLLDDTISTYKNYYHLYLAILSFHFILTYIPRFVLTSTTNYKIHNRKIGFNTILIGSNEKAVEIYKDIQYQKRSTGNIILGFLNVDNKKHYQLSDYIKHLGSVVNTKEVISKNKVREVIIALESSEHNRIGEVLSYLYDSDVIIKTIPDMYDILTGRVKISTIFGTPLIQISHHLMPPLQGNLKRIIDIFISIIAFIILFPLCIVLAIGIKLSSKGPILYSHERIGQFGKPFTLYKFRSMCQDAEKNGPELSSKNDTRITRFGRFMRKSRLDEIPNFFNVLIGDMAIVGPRPERKFYIDQIIELAPHYLHLQKVKPGITSWGQIKFGYAENVEEMINRLKYDILYIENMSIYVDLKILIYTLITIVKGRGI